MLDLGPPPRRRRASLTPMIDVVFLLLIFFMLAARFGMPVAQPLRLAAPSQGAEWSGPPRLVTVTPDGIRLNGLPMSDPAQALAPLMTDPGDPVIVNARDGATVQQVLDLITTLKAAGFDNLAVIE